MKNIRIISFVFICLMVSSCENNSNEINLDINPSLIHNEWQTISQRIVMRNGETHLLLCDTETFKKNGKFITSYTGMDGSVIKDSTDYAFRDFETLKFFTYSNGVLNTTKPEIAKIKILNKHLFVYHYLREDGSVMIIDSLKR